MLQDLKLLVDHGAPAASVETCATECWGATLGGDVAVARSALGIRDDGQLVWAAGESLSPAALARALTDAGVLVAGAVLGIMYVPQFTPWLNAHHVGGH